MVRGVERARRFSTPFSLRELRSTQTGLDT